MFRICAPYKLIIFVLCLSMGCTFKQPADLCIINARIYTCDTLFEIAEAMVIKNGIVLATGKAEALQHTYACTKVIDAHGLCVYPGFIDAHCHFTGYANDLYKCNLKGTSSFSAVIKRVSEYAKTHTTEWIYGRGWDQNDWNIQEFPDNTELNALFPDRPVILKRIDGHAILANAAALKRAGIHSGTKIAGGEVVLKNGKPTGLLIDNAMLAIERCVPELPDSVFSRYIKQTEMQCMALGLTSVHDCGVSTQVIQQLKKLYDSNTLNISIYALIQDQPEDISYWLKQGPLQYKGLHVGAFKIYADGALGSRGACLKKPYWDAPDQYGFMLQSPKQLEEKIKRIRTSSFQICTHAIGDSANHTILHLYQKYIASAQKKRWRIEHAQVLDFKDLTNTLWRGIIPSVQPTHALSDYLWAEKRIGIRIQGAYAYASLLRASNIIALGTDFPVEDINPLHTFIAAVFRTDAHGIPVSGFRKNEAISRTQALLGMTRWAAYAAFEEQVRGSLEPGKYADFILSSVDLLQDSEAEIRQFKVASTFIMGRRMYAEK